MVLGGLLGRRYWGSEAGTVFLIIGVEKKVNLLH
jgi:hypothetical protein